MTFSLDVKRVWNSDKLLIKSDIYKKQAKMGKQKKQKIIIDKSCFDTALIQLFLKIRLWSILLIFKPHNRCFTDKLIKKLKKEIVTFLCKANFSDWFSNNRKLSSNITKLNF